MFVQLDSWSPFILDEGRCENGSRDVDHGFAVVCKTCPFSCLEIKSL